MNQDFLIPRSAGLARRLVKLSKIATINLDPEIVEFAQTDLVSKKDFEKILLIDEQSQSAVQALIDYDFRAVFPGDIKQSSHLVLAAATLTDISPIFVISERPDSWKKLASNFGIEVTTIKPNRNKGVDPDLFKNHRSGLLIFEDTYDSGTWTETSLLSMDFPKTVFLTGRRLVSDLSQAISILFPLAPHDILTNNNPYFRKKIEQMGFKTSRPDDFVFLFNIVTDLMDKQTTNFGSEQSVNIEDDDLQTSSLIDFDLFEKLERNVAQGHPRLG